MWKHLDYSKPESKQKRTQGYALVVLRKELIPSTSFARLAFSEGSVHGVQMTSRNRQQRPRDGCVRGHSLVFWQNRARIEELKTRLWAHGVIYLS